MMKKLRVAIIFGGKSAEHQVSLQSAQSILNALDRGKYEPVLIRIDPSGKWHCQGNETLLADNSAPFGKHLGGGGTLALVPQNQRHSLCALGGNESIGPIDVVFPVLHGPNGEDGTIQGLLKMLDLPFVGAGVLGSAIGMDKDITKRLLRAAKIPVPDYLVFTDLRQIEAPGVARSLGFPVFVKPANLGSSVGVSKVKQVRDLKPACELAFEYDRKILVEQSITGREIECAVLGNRVPRASVPGEIIPKGEFYSYQAKYVDADGAALVIPARLRPGVARKVRQLALDSFKALQLEGLARVDFFLAGDAELYVNEVNTMPGFTRNSMYPKLWEASGIAISELVDRLIRLAVERHEREQRLKSCYVEQGVQT